MSAQHTQGRVKVQHPHTCERGWEVAFELGLEQLCQNITEANARRLVACWNACDGIDTEDLEVGSFSIIEKLHDKAAKELLAELKQCDEVAKRYIWSSDRLMAALKAASDQIDALGGDSTSYRNDIARVERRHHARKGWVK